MVAVRGFTFAQNGLGSVTIAVPAEAAVGDLLLLVVTSLSAQPTELAGWMTVETVYLYHGVAGSFSWRMATAADLGTEITVDTDFGAGAGMAATLIAVAGAVPPIGRAYLRLQDAALIPAANDVTITAGAGDLVLYVGNVWRTGSNDYPQHIGTPPTPVTFTRGTSLGAPTVDNDAYSITALGAETAAASGPLTQSFIGEQGEACFHAALVVTPGSLATNDDFANAEPVTIATDGGTYISPRVFSGYYTREEGELFEDIYGPDYDTGFHTAWWSYTPAATGAASFDTHLSRDTFYVGYGADTLLGVYTGESVGALTLVANNDEGTGQPLSTSGLSGIHVVAGVRYYVRVSVPSEGWLGAAIAYVLRVTGPATVTPGAAGGITGANGLAPLDLTPIYALDGLTFNATDAYGVDWIVTEEVGWSDTAPVRMSVGDREDAHGGVSGPVWRGARLISLKGVALAGSRLAMLYAKERLRVCADGGAATFPLTVAEAHMTRLCWVKQFAETRIRDKGAVAFDWELSLRSDDPFRYATDVISVPIALPATPAGGWVFLPGGVGMDWPLTLGAEIAGGVGQVLHPGNAAVYPTLTIVGPLTNPTVENRATGQRISLNVAVGAGDQVLIDMGARSLTINGSTRFDVLSSTSSWWQIQPGTNEIRFSAATGDTGTQLLTVTYRPAWK